jgi:predicted aldo/keto reductase-like oxidoreductase
MEYRRLGRTNLSVSVISFGGVPILNQTTETAIEAINFALDQGINYYDLDETKNQFIQEKVYLDGGKKIGQVLKQRRNDCYLGVKSMRQTFDEVKEDVDLALERVLKGTSREVIDIFHLAFLDSPQKMDIILSKQGGLRALEQAREEGKIEFILGAAHNPKTLIQAIKSDRFDVVEFPLNIIEDEYCTELIPLAKQRDIGTIAMKPVGGGQLASMYDLSLRWVLSHEVDCAIPGMKNIEEVKKNIKIGHKLEKLSPQELQRLKELGDQIGKEYCHRCGYCLPCPQGIMILGVLDLVKGTMLSIERKKKTYHEILKARFKSDPGNCVQCEECIEKCPFNLPIPSLMRKAAEMFE